jgi:hypothetical protein
MHARFDVVLEATFIDTFTEPILRNKIHENPENMNLQRGKPTPTRKIPFRVYNIPELCDDNIKVYIQSLPRLFIHSQSILAIDATSSTQLRRQTYGPSQQALGVYERNIGNSRFRNLDNFVKVVVKKNCRKESECFSIG